MDMKLCYKLVGNKMLEKVSEKKINFHQAFAKEVVERISKLKQSSKH